MAKSSKAHATRLAAQGRNGDTMLMHISPAELALLDRINPGSITRNPKTGQPEGWFWLLGALGKLGAAASSVGGAVAGAAGAAGGLALKGASLAKGGLTAAAKAVGGGAKDMVGSALGGSGGSGGGVMQQVGGVAKDMAKPGGPQALFTEKTGIPTTARGAVGKLGEKLDINPMVTESIQDFMPSGGGEGQQLEPLQARTMNQLQPPTVPTVASRQINRQDSVRNLVAHKFGSGSPVTKYIGSYEIAGGYQATEKENIIATVEPGERVYFSGDPNAPPASESLSADVSQPLEFGGSDNSMAYPEAGTGSTSLGLTFYAPTSARPLAWRR